MNPRILRDCLTTDSVFLDRHPMFSYCTHRECAVKDCPQTEDVTAAQPHPYFSASVTTRIRCSNCSFSYRGIRRMTPNEIQRFAPGLDAHRRAVSTAVYQIIPDADRTPEVFRAAAVNPAFHTYVFQLMNGPAVDPDRQVQLAQGLRRVLMDAAVAVAKQGGAA